jgi:hypothetical protein
MPNRIKRPLSVLVAVVALTVFFFQQRSGQQVDAWLALGLGVLMIAAMWIFPEAGGGDRR